MRESRTNAITRIMVEQDGSAENAPDPRELTFSQAQGYEPLPQPLALEEISHEARVRLWSLLYVHARSGDWAGRWLNHPWGEIFEDIHVELFMEPIDTYSSNEEHLLQIKNLVLDNLEFNHMFDFLIKIMRDPRCPGEFITGVATIFEECRLAYFVDLRKPVTILPKVSQQEGEALKKAMNELASAGLRAADEHLRKAAESINHRDWPESIHQSISAVESVARQLDPKAARTLGPALKSLDRSGGLHPALKEGFLKIYGYTSDEPGIRHALLDSGQAKVGQDEAVFMLGACASFASYLWRKHQAAR